MNDARSPWERLVKQGLFEGETYSEEMKLAVLDAVERKKKPALRMWKLFAGAVLACLTATVLISGWPNDATPAGSAETRGQQFRLTFQLLEAPRLVKGQFIYDSDPNILPGLSNKYHPMRNTGPIEQIALADIDLIEEKPIDGFGTALRYTLKEGVGPDKFPSFGFTADGLSQPGTLFHYGTGHMYDLEFEMTRLFGQEALKIRQPLCRTDGEGCAWYLKREAEGMITYSFFQADSYENDLDGDGKEEAIVTTYKQNQIYIFKESNGELRWSSVREALGADRDDIVAYDDALGSFTLRSFDESGEERVRTYRYEKRGDKLVEVEK
ncbi:hypothetical protein ACF3MZ_31520 [Paenibacillaceae bacterium WGS1546]|uniref:hypothetical protein n=1 Tax=Cohnella sp. WGS1546 TaxID=3366810 RepID=UPI00372D1A33